MNKRWRQLVNAIPGALGRRFEPANSQPADLGASTLPPSADEVLERNADVSKTIAGMLLQRDMGVDSIQVRRKLSTSEFVTYITITTDHRINELAILEESIAAMVHHSHRIEIARIFWRSAFQQR